MARILGTLCLWLLALLAPPGCARSAEPRARLQELQREAGELNLALDSIEERLIRDQATVQLWSELKDRHESVSAVACSNLGQHYQGMVRHLAEQEEKGRGLHSHDQVAQAPAQATHW
jgi:hypothetical protein